MQAHGYMVIGVPRGNYFNDILPMRMVNRFGVHGPNGVFDVAMVSSDDAKALELVYVRNNIPYKLIPVTHKAHHPAFFLEDQMPTAGGRDWACALSALTNASDAIYTAQLNGEHVIISCNMGRSQSVAVVAAYMLRYQKIPFTVQLKTIGGDSMKIQQPFADAYSALWFLWGVKGRSYESNPNLFEMVLKQLLLETAPVALAL